MKKTKRNVLIFSMVGLLLSSLSVPAQIIHRYSFSESSGTTNVTDSVGGANGVLAGGLNGNAAYFDDAGQVVLPGGGSSADPTNTIAGYVDLPNHLINGLTNFTFETWVTLYAGPSWQRILDFGVDGTGTEGTSGGGGNYIFVSSPGPDNLRFAVREPVGGAELTQCTAGSPLTIFVESCVTATYDTVNNVARLYVNGALVASDDAPTALSAINDINNWLGRSQWGDPMLSGSFNEFRIYENALDPVSAAASYFNGANNPSTDPASLGALQSVLLAVSPTTMTVLDTQTTIATADFANIAGVSLAGVPGVTYQSSNLGVATVSANGTITAVSAGNANITVSYSGVTSTPVAITVNPRLLGVVVAGALEVDLHATDLSTSTATWTNRAAASSTFTAEGNPVYNPNVADGLAGVTFVGNTNDYVGPGASAAITANSDFSIESWAFITSPKADSTLVAWGNRGTGGANVVSGSGNHPVYGAASFWGGGYDLGWSGPAPVKGAWHYYTFTYSGARVAKVYADGKLKTTLTVPADLVSLTGLPIRIGAQNLDSVGTVDFGQALLGSVALARVHTGLLSDNDVANNYLYGVELTPPGNLDGLVLTFAQTNLPGSHYKTYASVRPVYANRNYLVVNGFSTFSSSNTNVATVDVNGYVTAVATGSAQIIATYAGLSATNTITVTPPPATALLHRYSFNETTGTDVADSVGTANGTILGNGAFFDAGQLNLPGGTSSTADPTSIAGYVDLPNYLISPLVNVTYDTWATWQGAGNWQRIFDFGTSNAGEGSSSGEGGYMFLNAQPWRFAVRDIPSNGEPVSLNPGGAMPVATEFHTTVTYNFTENVSRFYTNGVLAATGPASVQMNTINDVNNWLGRSQWGDPMFQGSLNEIRIYEGALTAAQVADADAAGPNALPALTVPSLTVASSAGNVVISWPVADSAGYVLQAAGTATGTTWTNVTTAPIISGANYQVTVPPSGTQLYFKLTK
jgi:Concanavalin A-like lectin/glucanases superfamily/Bacterial Ig-like domain (group 2)